MNISEMLKNAMMPQMEELKGDTAFTIVPLCNR